MPFKFLFVSYDGLIGDIAWQVTKEGHEAKYFIEHAEEREIADGFVPQTTDWRADVDWADVIVFDDVLGHGTLAAGAAPAGKKVVGGTAYSTASRTTAPSARQELKAAGVNIIPQQDFTSFDDAIAFVRANPNRYVIKPSGEAQNLKGLLFVGEEEDGRDVIEVLEDYKRAWANQITELPAAAAGARRRGGDRRVLQRREFVYPISVNFEHKKLFPGDIGPSTGEMGTAMFWSEPNKIFNETLRKMEPRARARRLRRLHRRQLHRERERHLPARVHGALRLPDDQHPAGGPADADGRAAARARLRHAQPRARDEAASRSACGRRAAVSLRRSASASRPAARTR